MKVAEDEVARLKISYPRPTAHRRRGCAGAVGGRCNAGEEQEQVRRSTKDEVRRCSKTIRIGPTEK